MRLALCIIGAALLVTAVAGAFVLRGGEYAMFLLALGLVSFFGAMPVVLGVVSRRGLRGAGGQEEDEGAIVIRRSVLDGADAGGGEGANRPRG